jgi:hypothetical protein
MYCRIDHLQLKIRSESKTMYLEYGFLNPGTGGKVTGNPTKDHIHLAKTKMRIKDADATEAAVAKGYVRYGILQEDVKFCMFQYNGNEVGKRAIADFVDGHQDLGKIGVEINAGQRTHYSEYEREEFVQKFK